MKNFTLILFLSVACSSFASKDTGNSIYFMATQSATTSSVLSARQKALVFAKNTLATMVNGKVKNVTQSYIDHASEANKSADDFMTETRMTAKLLLQNVEIADEKVVQGKKGKYTVYITLKLRKEEVLKALCKRLKENEVTKTTFHEDLYSDLWKEKIK